MGWAVGYDSNWNRDIGYGVPAYCDHPKCNEKIHRGLSYVCCDAEPYGGEKGCGLYFCSKHHDYRGRCPKCAKSRGNTYKPKPDHPEWIRHKLRHRSWARWREENPQEVAKMKAQISRRVVGR